VSRAKWEYQILERYHALAEYELDWWGVDEWELVSVIRHDGQFTYWFKREVES